MLDLFTEIDMLGRKTRCHVGRCHQWAMFSVNVQHKQVKLCWDHVAKLAVELCQYGFVRRAVMPVIDEKGL